MINKKVRKCSFFNQVVTMFPVNTRAAFMCDIRSNCMAKFIISVVIATKVYNVSTIGVKFACVYGPVKLTPGSTIGICAGFVVYLHKLIVT